MSDTDIRVLIVDDQMMVREGFSVLLNAMPGITVVGEAVHRGPPGGPLNPQRPHLHHIDKP
ncbi:hypothetical protein ACFWJY_28035, partial [Streptomyces anulatus]